MKNKLLIYSILHRIHIYTKHELIYLYFILSMIFYEKGRKRLSLILQFIALLFLKLINPLLGRKTKARIGDYRLSFIKKKALRHPAWLLNLRKATLRVCISYKCNASCEFCYAKGLQDEFLQDMSLDNFKYLIRWAKANGWRRIMILGGEPTIHLNFTEMLDICYNQDISVSLLTNAFFNNSILERVKSRLVYDIAVNYPLADVSATNRKQFLHNLKSLSKEKEFLLVSGIIDGETDRWKKIVEMAARLKLITFWSLPLPTYVGKVFEEKIFSKLRVYGLQLFEILKDCAEKDIICYVCRSIPACIFTTEQWQQVKKMGRYLVFTRCFHGYRGDYAINLTVNPDLSTYPCSNFFIKGPSINFFKDRASISQYYERATKDIIKNAPMMQCNNCQLYQNFLSLIDSKDRLLRERLCDKNVCQAGCVENRDYRVAMHTCPSLIE